MAGLGLAFRISSAVVSSKSALGSTISINLTNPIDCLNKRVRLIKASTTYSYPNVSADRGNNVINFIYDGDPYTITLTKGIYSVSGLANAMREFCYNNSSLPDNLLDLSDDQATSFINLTIKPIAQFTMVFDTANSLFKDYLGFDGSVNTSTSFIRESNRAAMLNVDQAVLIHASFASGSYLNEKIGSNCIGYIALNHEPNSLIVYEPQHPLSTPINTSSLQTFTIWLTNQRLELLDMNGEDFVIEMEFF